MPSNASNKKTIYLVSGCLLFILITAVVLYLFLYRAAGETSVPDTAADFSIKKELYQNIASPKDFGQTLSPNEPGFGRENPFAPYK